MLTVAEAMQRARHNGVNIRRSGNLEWRVTLEEWTRNVCETSAYYTDDLEDAVLTGAAMRERQSRVQAWAFA